MSRQASWHAPREVYALAVNITGPFSRCQKTLRLMGGAHHYTQVIKYVNLLILLGSEIRITKENWVDHEIVGSQRSVRCAHEQGIIGLALFQFPPLSVTR